MTIHQIHESAQAKWPGEKFEADPLNPSCLIFPATLVAEFFSWLNTEPEIDMDYFEFNTCVDHPPDELHLVYSLYSTKLRHRAQFKAVLDRFNPVVDTVSNIWFNAEWNEREVFDLFGVFFNNHKDLRRLMMPEDWEGHPLRKDYMHPNLVARPD